mmetsp:Transcript_19080/g.34106  ORF Transcript_19080/g.34106 Transcript_19080/m.34106 type:complete len:475 (+) Transcript_19080:176-1600(+)|eukprot:CAMPEP_0197515934 /NCGR_PEP_ID=MMETSP1318-20131121/887_1 /TAXON_ID=552666 /ORGANISM="Partenskyella glossopodia, Strain RCC365" /LENGTH=474 /DNA_ID=CAMNT_0043064415 /DNA_START=109 /DNA_END=1533 /DNA_ORIENTATION=-
MSDELDMPSPPTLMRQQSEISKQLFINEAHANAMVNMAKADEIETRKSIHEIKQPVFQYDMALKDCVFVGHTNTDLDSIAAAIGAAFLFGGTAARASEINTETEWVLERWGFDCPPMFLDIENVQERKVCLVDFNQRSQLTKGVDEKQIVGIIDHHALRDGAVATDYPIYIDVRPWGSVATILSHTYFRNRVRIPNNIAGLLLSAILSDTLNLNSPTCTDIDKLMVVALSKIAGVKDVDDLAEQQFKAKSKMILKYSVPEILRGDLKRFTIRDLKLAFGVCETTDVKTVLERRKEILEEMKAMKAEDQDTFVFFAIIDVGKLNSQLLICGLPEQELAEKAFDAKMDAKTRIMNIGNRVSRKKTMVPPLGATLKAGFKLSADAEAINKQMHSPEAVTNAGHLELIYNKNCVGQIQRVSVSQFQTAALAAKAMNFFKSVGRKLQAAVPKKKEKDENSAVAATADSGPSTQPPNPPQ